MSGNQLSDVDTAVVTTTSVAVVVAPGGSVTVAVTIVETSLITEVVVHEDASPG